MLSKILIKINNQSAIYNKDSVIDEENENEITLTEDMYKSK